MAKKRNSVGALEIIVSIIVVIFVFSMVGILNIRGTAVQPSESSSQTAPEPEETSAGGGDEAGTTQTHPASFSGTELGSARSEFEIMP